MPAKPEPATSVPSPTSREIPRSDRNIYLTTEALAALPLRAQPPPPTEMPAKPEPMRSLLPREIFDQVAICCIYHQRPLPFAVLPLSSSPPPPNRDARKTGANVLSPTHRERPFIRSQYIIRSPSQLFYCAQPSIHAPPTRINNNTGTPETQQRIIGDPHAYIRRYQRPRIT